MKKFLVLFVLIVIVGIGYYYFLNNESNQSVDNQPSNNNIINQTKPIKITSSAFEHNQNIPAKYTCDGEGVNPPLEFGNVPENASSLVLIMDDPDAPMGTWVHWTIWNIDPSIYQIEENSVPVKVIQGKTSSGQNKYGGPCPPSGRHRYFFKLYALDVPKLELPSYSDKAALEAAMGGRIIDKAELMGLYNRQ